MKKIPLILYILLIALVLQACQLSTSKTYDIDKIIAEVMISYAEGDHEDHVTKHLGLPLSYKNDTKVSLSWTTSDHSVIDRFGTVNRPLNDTVITLELTVSIGANTRTKTFHLTVIGTVLRHAVTFDFDGDETVFLVPEGDLVSLPEPPEKEGFTFAGWSLDEMVFTPFDDTTVIVEPLILYAFFETELVMADVVVRRFIETIGGGTYEAIEELTYAVEAGTEVTYDVAIPGFVISQDSTTFGFASAQQPLELAIYYDRGTYPVTYVVFGEIHSTLDVRHEALAENIPLTIQGYEFSGWSLDETVFMPYDHNTGVVGPLTLYAFFDVEETMADVVVTRYVESIPGGSYETIEDITFAVEPGSEVTYDVVIPGFVISQDSISFGYATLDQTLELVIYYDRTAHTVTYMVLDQIHMTDSIRHEALAENIPLEVDGYIFNGWTEAGTIYDFDTPVTTDLTLVAFLEEDNITEYEGYYESINGLAGENLYDELHTILETTANLVNYGDSRYILDETDRDPNRSGYVILVYTGESVSGAWDGGITWNREHVWPQSLLGVSVSNSSISRGSDLHNLKPADPGVNSSRGNKYYDIITTGSSYAPRAEDRGDLARILFYMVVMYDDMVLVSGSPGVHQMALFNRLLEWHEADPVDAFEVNRNNTIYQYQDNRNPFVDHPELVTSIWGETPGNTSRAYDLSTGGNTYVIIYKPETDLLVFRRQDVVPWN